MIVRLSLQVSGIYGGGPKALLEDGKTLAKRVLALTGLNRQLQMNGRQRG